MFGSLQESDGGQISQSNECSRDKAGALWTEAAAVHLWGAGGGGEISGISGKSMFK